MPSYLVIPAAELGRGQPVKVQVSGDAAQLAQRMAADMLAEMRAAAERGRGAVLIIPVGPVDQFPILADLINRQRVDCRDVTLINMDEYLTDDDQWIPLDHPLSFRTFMQRLFYERLDPALAPRRENRVFPDPARPREIQQIIDDHGGVDACFGGIGINGHIAFNEPPAEDEQVGLSDFAELPTRVLTLTRETRMINSVTVGGEISIIPRRAVTVGMKECLAAGRMRFYCNRPWQSAVVRRVLHAPITPQCPASLLRLHPDASITMTDYVAQPPQIQLR